MAHPSQPTRYAERADPRAAAVRRWRLQGRPWPGGLLPLLAAALCFGLAASPAVLAQGIGADTETLIEAHGKLSQEVNDTLVAVARAAHPLTSKDLHLAEEGGVVVDEGGRLRLAITLNAALDDASQEQLEELGVEIEHLARDKQSFRAWVPAEAVEDLASLKIVVHVGPG